MSELRMEKLSMESVDITQENIEKIKELFPNVVTEGKIDFDQLKLILGEQIEARNERYQFTWNGKSDSIRFAQRPSMGTLRPDKESSKNWDTTENLYIEGDNLEVLKLLQKSYHNKIKMIYIDPPYNTGGDFVYKDDFKDNIKNYKEQTNQAQRANPETSGRYHTDWLNMMYPRLVLARNLLSEEGVIFISIDDNEVENLKKITVEIFGENNFIAQVVWERAFAPVNLKKHFSNSHDYIVCLAKSVDKLICHGLTRSESANNRYSNPDNDPRGVWTSGDLSVGPAIESKIYEIITPSGRKVLPPSGYCWRLDKSTFYEYIEDNRIWFGEDGSNVPRIKRFFSEVKSGITPMTIWKHSEVGHSQSASQSLKKLFNNKALFDYPKPVELIIRILQIYSNKDSIILDFFSGSSTTAHAVMQLNAEDGGKRKFIMVQLPELTVSKSESFREGYDNLCEIAQERIRRAGENIKNKLIEKFNKQGILEDIVNPEQLDIGFKVFKLDTSNLKTFDNSSKDLASIFSEDVFLPGRSSFDILYEILLKYGVFDKPVDKIDINGKEAFSIAMNQTIVYINHSITESDVMSLAKLKPREIIFDERGFNNDNDKINALKRLETAGVEKVATI